eukprot:4956298-Prymnesium_polylepis.1
MPSRTRLRRSAASCAVRGRGGAAGVSAEGAWGRQNNGLGPLAVEGQDIAAQCASLCSGSSSLTTNTPTPSRALGPKRHLQLLEPVKAAAAKRVRQPREEFSIWEAMVRRARERQRLQPRREPPPRVPQLRGARRVARGRAL